MSTYCYTIRFYEVKLNPEVIWLDKSLDAWDRTLTSLVNYIRMFEDESHISTRLVYEKGEIAGCVKIVWEEHVTTFYSDGSPVIKYKPRYSQEELAHIINTHAKLGVIIEPDGEATGSCPE